VSGLDTAGLSAHDIGHVGRQRGTDRFPIGVSGFVLSFFDRFEDALVSGAEPDLSVDPARCSAPATVPDSFFSVLPKFINTA